MKKKELVLTFVLLGVAGGLMLGVAFLWLPDPYWEKALGFGRNLWNQLGQHPMILYVCLAILPAFLVPQTPFLILAGMVYTESMGEGFGAAVAASAVALNILWSYFLTVGPLHSLAQRILSQFGYGVPKIPSEDHLKFSFLVRVTPILPLCIQNYILGLLKVPLSRYLIASWTTQVPLAFAIALTAGAILEGSFAYILVAIAVLLFLIIGLKWLRKRLRRDPEMQAFDEEMGINEVTQKGSDL